MVIYARPCVARILPAGIAKIKRGPRCFRRRNLPSRCAHARVDRLLAHGTPLCRVPLAPCRSEGIVISVLRKSYRLIIRQETFWQRSARDGLPTSASEAPGFTAFGLDADGPSRGPTNWSSMARQSVVSSCAAGCFWGQQEYDRSAIVPRLCAVFLAGRFCSFRHSPIVPDRRFGNVLPPSSRRTT